MVHKFIFFILFLYFWKFRVLRQIFKRSFLGCHVEPLLLIWELLYLLLYLKLGTHVHTEMKQNCINCLLKKKSYIFMLFVAFIWKTPP